MLFILFELFITFAKVGFFGFGGGYAIISLLQHEALLHNWLTTSQFADIVAISQITPGPIAVNMATFVGFFEASVIGSLVATIGVCMPSFVLVLVTMRFITKFKNSNAVKGIFYGLRPAAAGMIGAAATQIAWVEFFPKTTVLDFSALPVFVEWRSVAVFAVAFAILFKTKLNPILVIVLAAFVGLVLW